MSTYTDGPWEVEDCKGNIYVREAGGERGRVARLWTGRTKIDGNARLIAAAPDLLEALVDRMENCDACDPSGTYGPRCARCEANQALIAKATGGAR